MPLDGGDLSRVGAQVVRLGANGDVDRTDLVLDDSVVHHRAIPEIRQSRAEVGEFDAEFLAGAAPDGVLDRLARSRVAAATVRPRTGPGLLAQRPSCHQHASGLVRRRVGALATLVDDADAPIAVLACPPKELHDIPLLALGVLMSDAGWRVRYLGGNAPLKDLYGACERLDPDLIIMSGTRRTVFEARAGALRRLSQRWPMAIGGRGATPSVAAVIGADRLPEQLRDSAEFLLTSRDQYRRPAAGQ